MLPVPIPELEQSISAFLLKQRWYRAKAKNILNLRIADVIASSADTWLIIAAIGYQDGETAHYIIPLTSCENGGGPALNGLYDGLQSPEFRQSLLDAIATESSFKGEGGQFSAAHTSVFQPTSERLQSTVSRAEQSNSSIIFGQKYILKVFRKIESGINPDIEIGTFLTEHGFRNTPAVLGLLEYRPVSGEGMQAGILMQFVPNQGDAWKYTLESLAGFFERTRETAPALETRHPLDLDIDAAAVSVIGDYVASARLLGKRTAEMHRALTPERADPAFEPEPSTSDYVTHLAGEFNQQADITFDLLRDKQNMLSGVAAEDAAALLAKEDDVRNRLNALGDRHIEAVRIRHHGDYHLGQVLWTGNDFMIIDFEGEPARPLAERRVKTFAMRDVAGMVRSFSYAAYAAIPQAGDSHEAHESWAEYWGAIVGAEFLKSYFGTAANAAFVGSSQEERRLLFDAFLLQKALYEVAYELNNRPDWVRIPLRGILNLIGDRNRRTQVA